MNSVASAPGKAILFGEHAVVYGLPAIAVPLSGIRAYAYCSANESPLTLVTEDLPGPPLVYGSGAMDISDPMALVVKLTLQHLGASAMAGRVSLRSDLPIASGLGSGAAVSAALGRAIALLRGACIANSDLNSIVYEVEKLHHGTPSGIDNTVVVHEIPLFYRKDQAMDQIEIADPLWLVLADTGIAAPTRAAVADVRALANQAPARTAALFDRIGAIAHEARCCLERGATARLGELMSANHRLLRALHVSSIELDRLVEAALDAGAYGAKLSGGGRGGHIITLVDELSAGKVAQNLLEAGAKRVMTTTVGE
ncbi:MAG: mevalonate kinase [Chloroflexi bacterium]|nr:mevalonate kinase [Chloroflexota bacterium]